MSAMEVESPSQAAVNASRRPRSRFLLTRMPPPKTTLAAAIMLIVGLTLVILGVSLAWYKDGERGLALFILVVIPGSYATYVLYGAYMRWPGFDYSQIPSYDDN